MRVNVTAKGDDDGPAPRCEAPYAVTGKTRLRERVVAPVVFEDRLLRAQWGARARKDAVVTKVTSVDGKLSEGSKVASVRSLACGQAPAPKEDKQGAQRWWAVREGVCHGGARECAMGENVR